MNNPLVSIIIPTYNRADLILETLESIKKQTYTNWECIIVDDGSTDNTTEVVSSYISTDNRFQFHHRPEEHKPGGNGARNYGFKLSKGEYINWFDSDDLMTNEYIGCHINNFSNHPEIDISSCFADIFHSNPRNIVGKMYPEVWQGEVIKLLIKGKIFFLTPCNLWRKSSLTGKALFNEILLRSQEADFNFRRFTEGFKYNYIAKPMVLVRRGHSSIDSRCKKDIKMLYSQFLYYNSVQNWILRTNNSSEYFDEYFHIYYKQMKILYFVKNEFQLESEYIKKIYEKIKLTVKSSNISWAIKFKMLLQLKFVYYSGKGYRFLTHK